MPTKKPLENSLILWGFFIAEFILTLLIYGPAISVCISVESDDEAVISFAPVWSYSALVFGVLFTIFLIIYMIMYKLKALYSIGALLVWCIFWLLGLLTVLGCEISFLVFMGSGNVWGRLDSRMKCPFVSTFILLIIHIAFINFVHRQRKELAIKERNELKAEILDELRSGNTKDSFQLQSRVQEPPQAHGEQWVFPDVHSHADINPTFTPLVSPQPVLEVPVRG